MNFCRIVVFALVLAMCRAAAAGTLYTPLLDKNGYAGFSIVECSIVNVGSKSRTVKIEVWLAGSSPAEASSQVVLRPGDYWQATGGSCSDGCIYHCKFIVEGSKKDFRAAGCVKPQGNGWAFFAAAQ